MKTASTNSLIVLVFLSLISAFGCKQSDTAGEDGQNPIGSNRSTEADSIGQSHFPEVKALLASRFESLDELKKVVKIRYFNTDDSNLENEYGVPYAKLEYNMGEKQLVCVLPEGVSQDDFTEAVDGSMWDKMGIVVKSPFAVENRDELNKIYKLSRRRHAYFGEGDVAFYDLAQASERNINTYDLAYLDEKDSSEKGYLNTFNHVTAQALITTMFSKDIANFVAIVHERHNMPELVTGAFSADQLTNPNNNPVDNYVDLLNNQIGQELGERLKEKYRITNNTKWTPELLAAYLNDLQKFYMWSFGIGMNPFHPQDELIIQFCEKVNLVDDGIPFRDKHGVY